MPKRRTRPRLSTQELQRKHWRKALAIARILFEEDGYHTVYLDEIEAFITRTDESQHDTQAMPSPTLDADTEARVTRLLERMEQVGWWSNDPHDPRRGTEEDLGQLYEDIRQLVATDQQAAKALFDRYGAAHVREPVIPYQHREPLAPATGTYRVDHYPHSRFWAVYDQERLIAVTVYRRGAREVVGRLEMHERTIAALKRQLGQLPSLG